VVPADDAREDLAGFRGARLAVNGFDSQSGWGSILHHAAQLADGGPFFGEITVSGAHRASAAMVAEGAADLAAVDFVSWRLARRFVPGAAALRVLMLTDPTPGLPLIAAPGTEVDRHADAVRSAISGLDAGARDVLGLAGFAALAAEDYGLITARMAAAEARLHPPTLTLRS
jgi:ABC-type phosphate/phosphonate transport system substrate-binding protein